MIGYLSGSIIEVSPPEKTLILLAGGVGYLVKVSTEVLAQAKPDQTLSLFIHTAVREDDIALYGFETREEYVFFKQLISVSGVGPKIAMDTLSAPLAMTQNAIADGDVGLLTKIKGIGKKTAERIVLELKGKVMPVTFGGGKRMTSPPLNEDAVLALENLGYDKMHVLKVLALKPVEMTETGDLVKYFLKQAT